MRLPLRVPRIHGGVDGSVGVEAGSANGNNVDMPKDREKNPPQLEIVVVVLAGAWRVGCVRIPVAGLVKYLPTIRKMKSKQARGPRGSTTCGGEGRAYLIEKGEVRPRAPRESSSPRSAQQGEGTFSSRTFPAGMRDKDGYDRVITADGRERSPPTAPLKFTLGQIKRARGKKERGGDGVTVGNPLQWQGQKRAPGGTAGGQATPLQGSPLSSPRYEGPECLDEDPYAALMDLTPDAKRAKEIGGDGGARGCSSSLSDHSWGCAKMGERWALFRV